MNGRLPDGTTYTWLSSSWIVTACDWCHRRVWPEQTRLRLHDGKGSLRKGDKGACSTYLCCRCVRKYLKMNIPSKDKIIEQGQKESKAEERTLW